MALFPGSRHEKEYKFTGPYLDNQGTVRTVSWLTLRKPIQMKNYPDNTSYTLKANDSLQKIAYEIYGDPQFWWVIAEFNNIMDPTPIEEGGELFPGLILLVPAYERLFMEILG